MKKYIYTILLILLPVVLISAGNADFLARLKEKLNNYNEDYLQEKIYVQTDKTYYFPSEKIWYKAFLVEANSNKSSHISDVFYIELTDPWGNVVEKHDHNWLNTNGGGFFQLNENTPGGIYKLRAYTNWMKNWGEDAFFTKDITVQKVITPRLLLKLDFGKKAYGPGDEVTATLKVTDLNDIKTTGSIAVSTIRIGGTTVQAQENTTEKGEAVIKFVLPKNLDTTDGILQVVVTDKGVEESITRSIPIVLDKIQIGFFPEGGDMVEGVPAKVAFEALNEFGKGADVSGNIVDGKGKIITSFESFHMGMGAVAFTPQSGEQYFAQITKPQGNNSLYPLPQALKNTYALNLQSKDTGKLLWNIYLPQDGIVMLAGQSQGQLYYSQILALKKGNNSVEVTTNDFPAGVAVFTLFDGSNREACERLVYLNADKGLNIKIEPNKNVYAPGEKASVDITTTDKDGKPVSANIGLAVVDEQLLTLADDKQDNIVSYLLFSSELKGNIQEPYFYVDPTEPKAKEAMDYLMLTHGWRRFTWQEVLEGSSVKITTQAEKSRSVYGYVLNKKGKPTKADVFLIESTGRDYRDYYESGGNTKIVKLSTTSDGYFVFHNVDPNNSVFVTTKLPNQVYLFKGTPVVAKNAQQTNAAIAGKHVTTGNGDEIIKQSEPEKKKNNREVYDYNDIEMDYSLGIEVKGIGYGVMASENLSGSVISIDRKENVTSIMSSEQLLQGKIAGLTITQPGVSPDGQTNMRLRGISSVSAGGEPLVVINGVPVATGASNAFSMINANDLLSIDVIKNSSATAIYGSRAANGVIVVSTKNGNDKTSILFETPRYGGVFLSGSEKKREFYKARGFRDYEDNLKKNSSTVYWNSNVKTDNKGRATVFFNNNDQSSTFRITAEGLVPQAGLVGSNTKRIVTRKDFSLDAKVPLFAGYGDVVNIPVMAKNNTDAVLEATVICNIASSDEQVIKVSLPPQESRTVYFTRHITAADDLNIKISASTGKQSDQIERTIKIRQIYFPYQYSFSGKDAGQEQRFELPMHVSGTLQAEAVCYTSTFEELIDGVESIFREPYGCFEQLSSSTFPNIFALQLLKATGQSKPDVSQKAMQYLESGYKKLAAYEVSGGGFEWYGGSPAHEVLSAYGLVEFYEMNKVYDKVDKKMMERTLNFILSRRNGTGGFRQNNGKYGFSGAPRDVNSAYIVYALAETQNGKEIEEEYKSSLNEALKTKDLYRMALMANAAYNMGDFENYNKLVTLFKEYSLKNDFSNIKVDATIVYSYGESAKRETVAFWLLALLKKDKNIDVDMVGKCLQFINKGRDRGIFGTTQTTSICLQALTKYAYLMDVQKIEGSLCVNVNNNQTCDRLPMNKLKIDFTNSLVQGANSIGLSFKDTENTYPYSVSIMWQSELPPTSALCPLKLTATLASPTVKVNETVRLNVVLQNTQNEGKPMGVAIIGIPGGLSLQPWQLKELQEKEVFDFYEIIDDNLVVYFREFGPKEVKNINLDLKAEVPGEYTGIASSAYLYYMNEHKYWIKGLSVKIK